MSENQPRNAQARQRQKEYMKKERQRAGSELSKHNLTKKNEEFVFQLRKQLERQGVAKDKRPEIIDDTIAQLVEGQKSGKTAKALFGTPTEYVKELKNPKKDDKGANHMSKRSIRLLAVDNTLIFLSIFTFMFGLMFWLSPASMKMAHYGSSGITAILIVAISGGLLFGYVASQLQPVKKKGKWVQEKPTWFRVLTVAFGLVVWLAVYMASSLLPNIINPRLTPWLYIIIGAITFIGDLYFRRRFHITGSFYGRRRR